MARVLSFPRDQLVFVNETGSDARNFARKFGYSLRGMRAEVPSLLVHDGLIDVKLTTGTVNSDTFYDFIRGDLLPNLLPFDIGQMRDQLSSWISVLSTMLTVLHHYLKKQEYCYYSCLHTVRTTCP